MSFATSNEPRFLNMSGLRSDGSPSPPERGPIANRNAPSRMSHVSVETVEVPTYMEEIGARSRFPRHGRRSSVQRNWSSISGSTENLDSEEEYDGGELDEEEYHYGPVHNVNPPRGRPPISLLSTPRGSTSSLNGLTRSQLPPRDRVTLNSRRNLSNSSNHQVSVNNRRVRDGLQSEDMVISNASVPHQVPPALSDNPQRGLLFFLGGLRTFFRRSNNSPTATSANLFRPDGSPVTCYGHHVARWCDHPSPIPPPGNSTSQAVEQRHPAESRIGINDQPRGSQHSSYPQRPLSSSSNQLGAQYRQQSRNLEPQTSSSRLSDTRSDRLHRRLSMNSHELVATSIPAPPTSSSPVSPPGTPRPVTPPIVNSLPSAAYSPTNQNHGRFTTSPSQYTSELSRPRAMSQSTGTSKSSKPHKNDGNNAQAKEHQDQKRDRERPASSSNNSQGSSRQELRFPGAATLVLPQQTSQQSSASTRSEPRNRGGSTEVGPEEQGIQSSVKETQRPIDRQTPEWQLELMVQVQYSEWLVDI